jgi:polysaccharide deacetylase 2 family uncharacterized protein YibQ
MKLPALRIPVGLLVRLKDRAMTLARSLPRGAVVASGITFLILFLFLGISLLGGEPEASESSTVIQIHGGVGAHAPGLHDSGHDKPVVEATSLTPAVSLIAANGAIISDPELIEMTPDGPLPKIARDGRTPLSTYGRRPDPSDTRPRIAIIVGGLGMSLSTTQAAVDTLPPGVTLAFSPYGSELQGLVSAARGNGHEVTLEVPLEPYDYPNNDPGQNTLLAASPLTDNAARLKWVMSRVTGYAGLISNEGAKFLASQKDTQMLLEDAQRRGLYFLDSGSSDQSLARDAARMTGVHFARADVAVDRIVARDAIEKELAALEKTAMQKGFAVGVAQAYPASIEMIRFWAQGLEQKGFALVPVSGVVTAEKVAPPKPVPVPHDASHGKAHAPAAARPAPAKNKPAAKPEAHPDHAEHDNAGPHP